MLSEIDSSTKLAAVNGSFANIAESIDGTRSETGPGAAPVYMLNGAEVTAEAYQDAMDRLVSAELAAVEHVESSYGFYGVAYDFETSAVAAREDYVAMMVEDFYFYDVVEIEGDWYFQGNPMVDEAAARAALRAWVIDVFEIPAVSSTPESWSYGSVTGTLAEAEAAAKAAAITSFETIASVTEGGAATEILVSVSIDSSIATVADGIPKRAPRAPVTSTKETPCIR